MAKTKTSRIKRAEERIEAIVIELQKMGHLLNLTMNTLNEYIAFKKDLKKFCYNWIPRANPTMIEEEKKDEAYEEIRKKKAEAFKRMEKNYKNG